MSSLLPNGLATSRSSYGCTGTTVFPSIGTILCFASFFGPADNITGCGWEGQLDVAFFSEHIGVGNGLVFIKHVGLPADITPAMFTRVLKTLQGLVDSAICDRPTLGYGRFFDARSVN